MKDEIGKIIAPDCALPGGHYSHATRWRDLVFLSGQLPVRPDGTHGMDLAFDDQVRLALENLFAVLRSADSSPDRVLKVTAYIVGVERWPAFNRVFAEMFGAARPARAVVPVPELHYGYLIEVEAVAALSEQMHQLQGHGG